MKIYQCLVNGKQVGNLQSDFHAAKQYLINHMWHNPEIPITETSVWASDIYNRLFTFDIVLGCGIKVSIHEISVD